MLKNIKSAIKNRRIKKDAAEAEAAAQFEGGPEAYYDYKLDRMVRRAAVATGAAVVASVIVSFAGAVIEKAAELDEEN